MSSVSCDVFGMCNPLYDIQAEVSEDLLRATGYEKGGMSLIDEHQQQALVSHIYNHIVNAESGGSGANTMIGIAQLGGSACYTGKVGRDEHGQLYTQKLKEKGVTLCSPPGEGTTGICVVLITPDGERTLCTHLGICRSLGPNDVDIQALQHSKYLYVTGYLWDTDSQQAAVIKAMSAAKAAGVPIALSLADPFCVDRHKSDFLRIAEEYVDLLIGNEEEMQALTGSRSAEEAAEATQTLAHTAAITMGARGSLIRKEDSIHEIPAYAVDIVDSTGAGDIYAAGLLWGITHGIGLDATGRIASYLASRVVSKLGARLDEIDFDLNPPV